MKNRGFTIIELLVVVVIVGVLVGLSVPAFRGVFRRGRLEEARNEVFGFYQRTQRRATTEGIHYLLEVDKANDVFRSMQEDAITVGIDSVALRSTLDLKYSVAAASITFTIQPDGFVIDNDGTRSFSIYDSDTRNSLVFYISPLGVMEAETK